MMKNDQTLTSIIIRRRIGTTEATSVTPKIGDITFRIYIRTEIVNCRKVIIATETALIMLNNNNTKNGATGDTALYLSNI